MVLCQGRWSSQGNYTLTWKYWDQTRTEVFHKEFTWCKGDCLLSKNIVLGKGTGAQSCFICSFHGLLSCSPKGSHSKERRAIGNHKDTRPRTRTVLLLNKLLCQVYQITLFFLQTHFLEASPLLLPGVSMPPFIHSGMFPSRVILSAMTLALFTVKEKQFVS